MESWVAPGSAMEKSVTRSRFWPPSATAATWAMPTRVRAARDDAEKVAADVSPNPFNQALVFAGLGDRERTLDALERMSALGPARIGRALTFPEFAFVRSDPRIDALCKRVGLPLRKT